MHAEATALIVAEPGAVRDELAARLSAARFDVEQIGPARLEAMPDPVPVPDLLLISSALQVGPLAVISLRFIRDGRSPTTVVFPEGENLQQLEACVQAGYDYVLPPFVPSLLRSRLTSCWERSQLTLAVEEMATAASLRDYERELNIAREIQSGFLPDHLPTLEGWSLAARLRPARHVSGDFYDVIPLSQGRRLGLVVADVCDKGMGAALFMSLIRTLLRHTAEHTDLLLQPRQALDEEAETALEEAGPLPPPLQDVAAPLVQAVVGTNRYLTANHLRQAYFATMFFGVLDPASGGLVYVNGGHNPPILARANGDSTLLTPTGPAVGMLADSVFTLEKVDLAPGDCLFAYSDGVVEARDEQARLFGLPRLLDLVVPPRSGRRAEELLDDVDRAVQAHAGLTDQFDDITMLALCRSVP